MNGIDAGGVVGRESGEAGELLETVERVSRRTRRARHGYWFPLLLFGVIILATLPLYRDTSHPTGEFVVGGDGLLYQLGSPGNTHTWGRALFWLLAVPLGYIAVAVFYAVRARRTGLQTRIWPYVAAGLILFGFLLVTTPGVAFLLHVPYWLVSWERYLGDLYVRGLVPILVISLGFFVLARLERSWALFGIALAFLPVALLANLYNISNEFIRLGWMVPDWAANIAVAGGFLVFFGLISGLVTWRRSA